MRRSGLALAALGLLRLAACTAEPPGPAPGSAPLACPLPRGEEPVMSFAGETTAARPRVPPIDAAAPAAVETATFALG